MLAVKQTAPCPANRGCCSTLSAHLYRTLGQIYYRQCYKMIYKNINKMKSEILEKWCRRVRRFPWNTGLQETLHFVKESFLACVCFKTIFGPPASSLWPSLPVTAQSSLMRAPAAPLLPFHPTGHSLLGVLSDWFQIQQPCNNMWAPHSSLSVLPLFGLYRWIYVEVQTICCLDNLCNAPVENQNHSLQTNHLCLKWYSGLILNAVEALDNNSVSPG